MKTEFNLEAIKSELSKLKDADYLKKELAKLTVEIKKFDINTYLTPQAKARLRVIEKRFNAVLKRLTVAQKQFDAEVDKVKDIVTKTRQEAERKISALTSKATGKAGTKRTKAPARKKATTKKTARAKAKKSTVVSA